MLRKTVWVIFVICFSHQTVYSQVTAAFSPSESEGCNSLLVTFTNQSTPLASIDSVKWDFGNGNISSLPNPSALFPSPGIYTVKLTAYAGGESDETQRVINVYEPPDANFTTNNRGCVPHTVNFTDLSTPGDAAIETYKWDFKNGDVLNGNAPEYTYYSAGKYSVTLTIIDANSCQDTISAIKDIDVVNPPVASFTANPPSSCTAPVSVFFNNRSTGDPTVTYAWNFGDGNSAEEKSPTHLYESYGENTVTLTATSTYGCESQISSVFNISAVTVDGAITQNGNPVETGDTICAGTLDFENASEGTGFVLWDFGDGTASSSGKVSHPYQNPGMYKIKLIASPNTSCADTLTWSIYVDGVKADYEADPSNSCLSPLTVNYTNTSVNAETILWEFADGSTSNIDNPVKSYVLPPDTDPYAISGSVPFNATLTVTSAKGCQDYITKAVIIKKPTAVLLPDTTQGCAPLNVSFADKSVSDQDIVSYTYLFGNGESHTSATPEVSYLYQDAGIYQARLVITTQEGCTDTSYAVTIKAGNVPSPNFSFSSSTACPGEPVQLNDLTPASDNIDQLHWQTDNVLFSACPDDSNPQVTFRSGPGYKDITLTVGSRGCYASKFIDDAIMITGPYGTFESAFDCSAPKNYTFTSSTQDIQSFKWLVSDGTENTTDAVLNHAFAGEGEYTVSLVTYKDLCTDTFTRNISVRENMAEIIADTLVCAGFPVGFKMVSSAMNMGSCAQNALWQFNDGSRDIRTNQDSVSHIFPNRGTYTVKLFVENDNGCIDSTQKTIQVFQPYASFTADTTLGCAPFPVEFTDGSTPNTHPLKKWKINYADGNPVDSFMSAPTMHAHLFQNPGEFNVVLAVTDTLGCTNTDTITIKTANPSATFTLTEGSTANACAGTPLTFAADYSQADSLIWDFGDGTIVRTDSFAHVHTYMDEDSYTISLTAYKYGCSNSFTTDDDFIHIQKADASFISSDTIGKCYPKEITFTYDDDATLTSRYWNFGTGDDTEQPGITKIYTYLQPGLFAVEHRVETSFGCKDTSIQEITISGPSGSFTTDKHIACIGDEINFTLTDTSNVYRFEWDLGDGTLMQGSPVSHRYNIVDTVIVGLILYGDSGACKPPPVLDTIFINRVFADFTLEDTSLCSGISVVPENKSVGYNALEWDLDNGSTTGEITPEIWYNPGTYALSLMVWNNENGCRDTLTKMIVVSPSPQITISADELICFGDPVQLNATGGDVIQWLPSESIANPQAYNTLASPAASTTFLAEVTDTTFNCATRDSIYVFVQQVPELSILPADTAVVIGEEVELMVSANDSVTLEWASGPALSCFTCPNPWIKVLNFETIKVSATDMHNCFTVKDSVLISLREVELKFDMPNAFSPNGDGANDVLYVKGWGIKELLEFQVYNRWGNLVFSTTDAGNGWDGTLKGVEQPIDTYVYNVVVKLYDNRVVTKKGTVSLLR